MADQPLHADHALMAKIADGDHRAFALLYNRYWPLLYLHAYRMLRDEKAAEDAVQETFTWFWKNAPLITFKGSVSSYLYGAIRHHVLNQIRHEKVKGAYFDEIAAYITAGHYQVDEVVRYNELVEAIESEIDRMPPRMREIFNLSRKHLHSHKEIAELLGISESTVREQIKRALRQLRVVVNDKSYLLLIAMQLLR
ncbi:DNA-directed RNA polymerase sigma-70 factor [Parapedobacter defluvii]|uniref:DNA-directed RNA polymerase sigma-70 factor n=1 Tax=Parapedobacter defluvii TaxID=2045106 RepID=A0ABQ1MIA5_9SPHI|nr:RNA polymerase sigma-70 factor [Parapedobacter defluvii]GGC40236.1 DNA-directed RNA polymerase sigma-70 factor [Parapedobacter defluvii]